MSGSGDDVPATLPKRGALPPPPLKDEDGEAGVSVPRMEPPPPSLEAMVQSARRGNEAADGGGWVWIVMLVVFLGLVTAYVLK